MKLFGSKAVISFQPLRILQTVSAESALRVTFRWLFPALHRHHTDPHCMRAGALDVRSGAAPELATSETIYLFRPALGRGAVTPVIYHESARGVSSPAIAPLRLQRGLSPGDLWARGRRASGSAMLGTAPGKLGRNERKTSDDPQCQPPDQNL
jgi:hypothetical protein